jgi:molybdate transport system substrate-binding protein
VNAAEIKVLSTHAALDVLSELGPKFERASGHRLSFSYDPAKAVRRQIENGAVFDIAIVTRPVFDALAAQGMILAGSRADIGRSGLGVAVR